jgi:hypothetical protein
VGQVFALRVRHRVMHVEKPRRPSV